MNMTVVKWSMKIVLLPVLLALFFLQCVIVFLSGISDVIVRILSTCFCAVAILGLVFGGCTGEDAISFFVAAFVFFMIPIVGFAVAGGIGRIREWIWEIC